MEPDLHPEEQTARKFENLHRVTPLSKYLAMALFVILPFVGGWIGYIFAPDKVVEVKKEVSSEENLQKNNAINLKETEIPQQQTVFEDFNIGLRDKYNRRERYDLYSIISYRDSSTDEIVVDSSVLGKHRDDAEVILRSTSPLVAATYKKTTSLLTFEVLIDSVLYKGADLQQLGGSVFTGQKKWFYTPLSQDGNPLFSEMRELTLSQIGVDESNSYVRNLYGLVNEAADWNVEEAAKRNHLLISKATCSECGGAFTEKVIVVNLANRETFLIEGRLAYMEWVDEKNFKYKLYPEEGHSEYVYITQDRDGGGGCGMGGCPKSNINWDNIAWQEGSI
jgi:hypothetical protein